MAPSESLGALLDQLEAAWREMDAPIVHRLAPGASSHDLDRAERLLGLELPRPLREWWGWHDGVDPAHRGRSTMEVWLGGRSWRYLSLAEAVEVTRRAREIAERAGSSPQGLEAQRWWGHRWIAVSEDSGGLVVAADTGSPVGPTRQVDWEAPLSYQEEHFATFAELLEAWILLLDQGVWRWDGSRWVHDRHAWAALPARVKAIA